MSLVASKFFFSCVGITTTLSSFEKKKNIVSPSLTLIFAPYKQEENNFLLLFCLRKKIIERAHTRVLVKYENWTGRLWYRELTGKLVVSVGQMWDQRWQSHNVRCPFNKQQRFSKKAYGIISLKLIF